MLHRSMAAGSRKSGAAMRLPAITISRWQSRSSRISCKNFRNTDCADQHTRLAGEEHDFKFSASDHTVCKPDLSSRMLLLGKRCRATCPADSLTEPDY